MMKIGMCAVPRASKEATGDSRRKELRSGFEMLRNAGFDYVEMSVGSIGPRVEKQEFELIRSALKDADLPALAFNSFIPGELKITGPDSDRGTVIEYAEESLERAAILEGRIVVFGSGRSRRIPDGWPRASADEQIADFLTAINPAAEARGITIVIEHLNRGECNWGTSLAEVDEFAKQLNLSNVQVLADSYHMLKEDEPFDGIEEAGSRLQHVHVASGVERACPTLETDELKSFFSILNRVGYTGGVSAECRVSDLATEAPQIASLLHSLATST